jgi:hypothetical protein
MPFWKFARTTALTFTLLAAVTASAAEIKVVTSGGLPAANL